MDDSLIIVLVTFLTLAVALNLLLTLRLATAVHNQPVQTPLTVPIGQRLPDFAGRRYTDRSVVSAADLAGQPAVLIFLSAACGDCRKKLPELLDLHPSMRSAGVLLWIVGTQSDGDIVQLLQASPLIDDLILLPAAERLKLNPRNSAPFYIFVDHQGAALASNFLGDEDWQSFLQQMAEVAGSASPWSHA